MTAYYVTYISAQGLAGAQHSTARTAQHSTAPPGEPLTALVTTLAVSHWVTESQLADERLDLLVHVRAASAADGGVVGGDGARLQVGVAQ